MKKGKTEMTIRSKKYAPIVEGDRTEVLVIRRDTYNGGPPATLLEHTTEQLTPKARLALEWAARWAMVAAEPDGEDSAGRQKARRLTPAEISTHACDTVAAIWEEFRARGWILDTPPYSELVAKLQDAENGND